MLCFAKGNAVLDMSKTRRDRTVAESDRRTVTELRQLTRQLGARTRSCRRGQWVTVMVMPS
eukprot:3403861-Rhodomonas_salina.1